MHAFFTVIAFLGSLWAGVYLCTHDFPCLGGWVCILTLLATWGYEKSVKR